VSAGRVWVREVLVKILLITVVGVVLVVADLVNSLWVFFDKNRQALHDKIVSTIVVYAPFGLPALSSPGGIPSGAFSSGSVGGMDDSVAKLRELAKLHAEGILTDDEYERKRKEIAEHL